ncbi:tetratricopeptide repeat protein [Methanobrevibacter sp.]|uniref:tetratricopeptide repeat protein n=1 Tax=Methanobrevibacter sp. TaxID=66852 RepID=UPI00386FEC91
MTIQKLLDKCEDAYIEEDFKTLLGLCDEVLGMDPDNQTAIGYKSVSCCFLGHPEKAVEILEEAIERYPNNYYMKNNLSMAYYDLGEYEMSLECCDEGLKIKEFDWLVENRIKALLKLDRTDEAIECYEKTHESVAFCDLLVDAGKYSEALEYFCDDYNEIVDKIKERDVHAVGDFYLSWIDMIKSRSDTRVCPDCGGELIPIVWGYPSPKLLKRAERGEVFLGGCCIPPNNPNYRCKKCDGKFDLGVNGLHVECLDFNLNEYIEYKIKELTRVLNGGALVFIHSRDTIKRELKGYDDEEFDALINHLVEIGYIYEPREGYFKLAGFDDWKCAKEYLDEGKFAAPLWLAYPQFSAWTIFWRMSPGEDYGMNHPHHSKEYKELFPMPEYWKFRFGESPYKPHPLLGYFWTEDGKPKYPHVSEGVEVNGFITLGDEKQFQSDTFTFKSIEHAEALSKYLYFEKHGRRDDEISSLELSDEDERLWDVYKYSVLLNASYFKVMQDEDLKDKLLETGDKPLVYVSDDEKNLFGRALMEVRDEIRRVCRNEDLIDWEYTEYLKHKPWW